MRSNRRLRRDDEAQVESELPSESPAPVPEIASVLALQRYAGNRAVARLMYNPNNTRLVVPESFGSRRVPWEDKKLRKGGAQATDKTLAELANEDAVFRGHLMRGMHVKSLSEVGVVPDAELQANAAKLAKPAAATDTAQDTQAKQAVTAELSAAAVAHDRLLSHSHPARYGAPAELDIKLVMSQLDRFVPGLPDLPSAETDLFTRLPGQKDKDKTYWTYACVLIALVKSDRAKAQALTRSGSTKLEELVQGLHAYYVRKGIQYDDTSTRFTVMDEWGYKPIFIGETTWLNLPTMFAFPAGDYIFDIVGHTVAVNVPVDIPKTDKPLSVVKGEFVPDSDGRNYARGLETGKKVLSIWKK